MKPRRFLSKKTFKKCLIITGLFLLIACLYILSFIYGKPTIETDYLAQLNQINKPKNYNPQDNAWPYYQKAFELYIEPNAGNDYHIIYDEYYKDFSDFNDIEQSLITQWIELNKPAMEEFIKASSQPYCYIEYKVTEAEENDYFGKAIKLLDTPTMSFNIQTGNIRKLSFLCRLRIKYNTERGDIEQAIEDCFYLYNAAFHCMNDKITISQLLGLSCYAIGNEELMNVISKKELSLKKLEEIQNKLTNTYRNNSIKFDLEAEKIVFQDIVQHVFTKGPFGSGHLLPKYLPALIIPAGIVITMRELDPEPTNKEKLSFLAISLLHAGRNKTISKYNKVFEQMIEIQNMSPYEQKKSGYSINIDKPEVFNYKLHLKSFTKQSKYLLVNIYVPPMDRLSGLIYERRTECEAIIIILALKRYAIEKGTYPDTLEELLDEGYISKIPMDPYSDKPLVYKKAGDNFTLYSVGEDFKDDNGKVLFSGGRIDKWGRADSKTGGDAVFWPAQ
jgi:hypothetical protein